MDNDYAQWLIANNIDPAEVEPYTGPAPVTGQSVGGSNYIGPPYPGGTTTTPVATAPAGNDYQLNAKPVEVANVRQGPDGTYWEYIPSLAMSRQVYYNPQTGAYSDKPITTTGGAGGTSGGGTATATIPSDVQEDYINLSAIDDQFKAEFPTVQDYFNSLVAKGEYNPDGTKSVQPLYRTLNNGVQQYSDDGGETWKDMPKTTTTTGGKEAYRTEQVTKTNPSDGKQHTYLVTYDKDGNVLSEQDQGEVKSTSAEPYRTEQVTKTNPSDGKVHTYTVTYDKDGNVLSEVDNGASSNKQTFPLPPGYQQTYTDANGRVFTWDENAGTYQQTGYNAAADTSKSNNDVNTQGRYTTYQDALNAAGTSGYLPYQLDNGYWILQAPDQMTEYQRRQLELQEKQRLADMAANPVSWLQYSSEAGTTPQIQPWMLPLQPGQYGWQGTQRTPVNTPAGMASGALGNETNQGANVPAQINAPWSVGQDIPGYSATDMSNLPTLLNPSTQLYARMSPSARGQYAGYQLAATGARPEDTAWLLQNQAPPSGANAGLKYVRG